MLLEGHACMTEEEAQQCSPLRLAYIGDTVWDLLTRTRLMYLNHNLHHMHEEAIASVNAHAQSQAYAAVSPFLTQKEEAIARRGRNAHARHGAPKHQSPADYQAATALETLFGYLYLTGQEERIRLLFAMTQHTEESHA